MISGTATRLLQLPPIKILERLIFGCLYDQVRRLVQQDLDGCLVSVGRVLELLYPVASHGGLILESSTFVVQLIVRQFKNAAQGRRGHTRMRLYSSRSA